MRLEENMIKSLVSIVIMMSMIGCVSASDGSGTNMMPGEATASQYSQYYTMPNGLVAGTHIIAPQQYQISGNAPATVYYQQKAIPYDQYLSSAILGGNSLWIQGSASWTQYAQVPQGAFLSLIATSSTGGNGYLNEIYPESKVLKNNYYYFPGYNQIGFYADTIGQHILLFVINGQVSNAIVIDVVSYQPPVYQQPVYQQPVYQQPVVYPQPVYVSPVYYQEIYEPEPIIRDHRDHDWPHGGNASPTDDWMN
jgi:hypothetical protein